MTPIKLGTPVRQIVPAPVEGVVVSKQFVEATDSFQYLVEWPDDDGDGQPQTRWFDQHQIEVIGDAAADFVTKPVDAAEQEARAVDALVKQALATPGAAK